MLNEPATKRQILERLVRDNHISVDEMWVLLGETYIPPFIPDTPQFYPYTLPYTGDAPDSQQPVNIC